MRAYVFTDERLSSRAGQFVWLSIDTEKEGNAAWLKKYPVNAYPSYFIVDGKQEKVSLRYVGGASVPELLGILDEGRSAVASSKEREGSLAEADDLYGKGDYDGAAKAYAKALKKAPKGWPSYGRAVGSFLFALSVTNQAETCTAAAREALTRMADLPATAGIAASGLDCALSLDEKSKDRAEQIRFFENATRKELDARRAELAADDVSGIYQILIAARDDAGDAAGKEKLQGDWSAALDDAAAAAPDAEARAVFDSHRLAAYIATGHPEKAVPMLEASEKDLPGDYNPPARLAAAYKKMKRWDDALKASDRALSKAYGPRKLLILSVRSEIYDGKGDRAAARKTLEDAIAFAKALPEEQRHGWPESLQKKLAKLDEKPASAS